MARKPRPVPPWRPVQFRTWIPSRFGAARPRYFRHGPAALHQAAAVFDATRCVVAVEAVDADGRSQIEHELAARAADLEMESSR